MLPSPLKKPDGKGMAHGAKCMVHGAMIENVQKINHLLKQKHFTKCLFYIKLVSLLLLILNSFFSVKYFLIL